MGHGKGKQEKIRKAAQHNKQVAQAHASEAETAETVLIPQPVPPTPPTVSDKAPNWFQRNPILTNIIVATVFFLIPEIYHSVKSGPRISIRVHDYLQHFHKFGSNNETKNIIMIPATIINTGDKKYFLDIIKCELKIHGEWRQIEPTEVDTLNDVRLGTFDTLKFTNLPLLNSDVAVGGDDELHGRFIFKTDSVNIISKSIHECRLTLIDRDENKTTFEKDLDKPDFQDADDWYRKVGIKRDPSKLN